MFWERHQRKQKHILTTLLGTEPKAYGHLIRKSIEHFYKIHAKKQKTFIFL